MLKSHPTRFLAAALLLGLAGSLSPALAQPPDGPQPPPRPLPLGGPQVTDRVAPFSGGTFGGGKETDKKKAVGRELPHPAFMRAVHDAIGEGAPADLRVSAEVEAKIKAIDADFSDSMKSFAKDNREALQQMRQQGQGGKREAKKGGPGAGKPDGAPEMDPAGGPSDEQRQAMMEKMRELRDKAPSPGDAHTRIWALLNDSQKAAVEKKLEVVREEMQHQDNERYVQRRAQQKNGGGKPGEPGRPGGPGAPGGPEARFDGRPGGEGGPGQHDGRPGAAIAPEQRDRIMRLLERLSPQQREELIRRFEERAGQGAQGGPGPQGAPGDPRVPEAQGSGNRPRRQPGGKGAGRPGQPPQPPSPPAPPEGAGGMIPPPPPAGND
ncbi:hypothetical protein BH11PLA1_BH11PLA1_15420 [soil metagenome]